MSVLTQSPLDTEISAQLMAARDQVAIHAARLRDAHIPDLFTNDAQRFEHYSLQAADLVLDYAKNRLDDAAIASLLKLADAALIVSAITDSFEGKGDHPMTGYIALRLTDGENFHWHDVDYGERVLLERKRCGQFAEAVRSGRWLGESSRRITDVVNIGVGGSDLGPRMVTAALREFAHTELRTHFVSSVDSHDLFEKLATLKVESTLFVIASKSFRTQATLANARAALAWFAERGGKNMAKHFVAVTANADAALTFGITAPNLFPVWDWVSGRFSFWCANGLTAMISIGARRFDELLAGARVMDKHFRSQPLAQNMPVLLSLIDTWYGQGLRTANRQTVATHYSLRCLPEFIDRLDDAEFESPGAATGSQTLVDFIITAVADHQAQEQQLHLLAHSLGQSRALMLEHNSPSNTIVMTQLKPASLGALIALFEHKAFVSRILMRGASKANAVLKASTDLTLETGPLLAGEPIAVDTNSSIDSSTIGLVNTILQMQKPLF